MVLVAMQVLLTPVPLTVYTIELKGLSLRLGPLMLLGSQVYVLAPLAVKLTEPPEHTNWLLANMLIVGLALVSTTCEIPETQPTELVAATEYRVGPFGTTVTEVPDKFPGVHV